MSELSLYEEQLQQIQSALESCENEADRKNLESLEKDLKELINLSFLQSLEESEDSLVKDDSESKGKVNQEQKVKIVLILKSHKTRQSHRCQFTVVNFVWYNFFHLIFYSSRHLTNIC